MSGVNPQQIAQAITNFGRIAQVVLLGGAAVYGVSHSLFNVEGGHRAIVFNRVVGIKDTVRSPHGACTPAWQGASWAHHKAATDPLCRCMRKART